ncbi:MAG: hypothetical protein GTO12_11715 [Proteobacteria bacterium]|nr:hypothetical protein [Pseudomonadota bacterium]
MKTAERYSKFVNISLVEKVQPVVIETVSGAMITDTEGRNFIDCFLAFR